MGELEPWEKQWLQEFFLHRWLIERDPHVGRRRGDLPLPEAAKHLSPSQLDRFCRWVARQWQEGKRDRRR